jgi:hypothetical protein
LGYSKKGYTDGEIGRAWIENFDKETRAKVKGRRCLLLVDRHNSHYTLGFLNYARAHQIEVVGYPSHAIIAGDELTTLTEAKCSPD